MSLLYECINTVIAGKDPNSSYIFICLYKVLVSISSGLPNHNASIQLCVQKLRILIEDSDQNRKKNKINSQLINNIFPFSKISRFTRNVENLTNTSEKCTST
jgi:hypothetical protein